MTMAKQEVVQLVSIGMAVSSESWSYVSNAIRSVHLQSVTEWELIVLIEPVVDDEVRANLLSLAKEDHRIQLHFNKTKAGYAHNLNRATELARGGFLARIDADDMWLVNKLEEQITFLKANPAYDIVVSEMLVIDEHNNLDGLAWKPTIPPDDLGYLRRTPMPHVTGLARTGWWEEHLYDESIFRAEDRIFWLKAHSNSSVAILNSPSYVYRIPRNPDLKKYLHSSKGARAACRKYGPIAVGWKTTILILGEMYLKDTFRVIASCVGLGALFRSRSIRPLRLADHARFADAISDLVKSPGRD